MCFLTYLKPLYNTFILMVYVKYTTFNSTDRKKFILLYITIRKYLRPYYRPLFSEALLIETNKFKVHWL